MDLHAYIMKKNCIYYEENWLWVIKCWNNWKAALVGQNLRFFKYDNLHEVTIPVKLNQNFIRSACIQYVIPFKTWKVWREVLNKFWNCLSEGNRTRNNVQPHQAKRFRCYSHIITMMGHVEIKIWKVHASFIAFLKYMDSKHGVGVATAKVTVMLEVYAG